MNKKEDTTLENCIQTINHLKGFSEYPILIGDDGCDYEDLETVTFGSLVDEDISFIESLYQQYFKLLEEHTKLKQVCHVLEGEEAEEFKRAFEESGINQESVKKAIECMERVKEKNE